MNRPARVRWCAMAALALVVMTGIPAVQSFAAPPAAAVATPGVGAGPLAYLQGVGQEQLLCPGGPLQGKVGVAIVEALIAGATPAGRCNLADIKAANPKLRVLAYVNIAAMAPATGATGTAAAFQPSCVSSSAGATYAVPVGTNARMRALNPGGVARYPDFPTLVLANVSSTAYRTACSAMVKRLLATASTPGAKVPTAPRVRFDGVMFDDVNMSPQHGIDIATLGSYGPWKTDAAYGDDLVSTVAAVAGSVASAGAIVAANVGVTTWDPARSVGRVTNPISGSTTSTGAQRALALASSRRVNLFVREYGVQWSDGTAMTAAELTSTRLFNGQVASYGVTVAVHDYAVDLRNVSPSTYLSGKPISPSASCLTATTSGASAIVTSAGTRRANDQELTAAFALMNRTSTTRTVVASINQAQPHCQGPRAAESITKASVALATPVVASLLGKLAAGAYRNGSITTIGGTVDVFRLSDGSTVYLNRGLTTANTSGVVVPARAVIIR